MASPPIHKPQRKNSQDIENDFKNMMISDEEKQQKPLSGGYIFNDQEFIDDQRGMIWSFIKNIGSNIFEGKNLMNVSLPVVLFEPRSFLESLTDIWAYEKQTILKAAKLNDPLERFKLTMIFVLAGLHHTPTQKKPFNPILGETWQAKYDNGTEIFMEQTSHHPPISHFHVVPADNSYQLSGWGGWNASFRGNSLKGYIYHKYSFHYIF